MERERERERERDINNHAMIQKPAGRRHGCQRHAAEPRDHGADPGQTFVLVLVALL